MQGLLLGLNQEKLSQSLKSLRQPRSSMSSWEITLHLEQRKNVLNLWMIRMHILDVVCTVLGFHTPWQPLPRLQYALQFDHSRSFVIIVLLAWLLIHHLRSLSLHPIFSHVWILSISLLFRLSLYSRWHLSQMSSTSVIGQARKEICFRWLTKF